jgi:hypothetical protein
MGLTKNTVRLKAVFSTFAGVVTDVTGSSVSLTIYNKINGALIQSYSGSAITKESTGTYFYDYTIPVGPSDYVYEWSGTLEGNPIVNRGILQREYLRT